MKKALFLVVIALLAISVFAYRSLTKKKDVEVLGPSNSAKVERGDLVVTVVDTGVVDAAKVVELKSRVSGRLARLLVDEGDLIQQGELVAEIDPQETALLVRQNAAQLRGAQSAVQRANLEIGQRSTTARATFEQSKARYAQLQLEVEAQPKLTAASIASAETALATAEQEKVRLLTSAQPTSRTQMQGALAEAEASLANSESEYRRQADLEVKGYVAGKAAESAKLNLDLARVRRNTARENLEKLVSQQSIEIQKADEAIRQARAELARAKAAAYQDQSKIEDLKSAKAEMEKARAALNDPLILAKQRDQSVATVDQLDSVLSDAQRQLGETQVRAPISGVVSKKMLEVGELATGLSGFSAGTPIVRIEDRRSMRVKLDVNEIDVARLQIGQEARVEVDALPGEPMTGRVVKIAPASKQGAQGQPAGGDAVVRYEVEVRLDNPTNRLRSGMSAKCSMDVLRRDQVLVLPIEFAEKKELKYFVDVVTATKPKITTERKEIKVGAVTGSKLEVLSGLKLGDQVKKPKYTGPKRQGMMMGPGDDHEE